MNNVLDRVKAQCYKCGSGQVFYVSPSTPEYWFYIREGNRRELRYLCGKHGKDYTIDKYCLAPDGELVKDLKAWFKQK